MLQTNASAGSSILFKAPSTATAATEQPLEVSHCGDLCKSFNAQEKLIQINNNLLNLKAHR